jgi:hypothetical protein
MRLHRLFESIALAMLAGCVGGPTIDRSKFVENVCDADGLHPFRGIKPANSVDGAVLRDHLQGPMDTVGLLCGKATDIAACQKTANEPTSGWTPPHFGDVEVGAHSVVASTGDTVLKIRTIAELKRFLGEIDNVKEAALLVDESTPYRISCGKNARSLPDGSFEILAEGGTGCGDDIELHVIRVKRDGTIDIVETETLEEGEPDCQIGRRPEGFSPAIKRAETLGDYFAKIALLEAAAVPAFERLARELRAHGAPMRLVRAAERSARDEIRHARAMEKLANRFGGIVQPLVVGELPIRPLHEIALENAVEGCVRETFGALLATYQAHAARDPQIAKVMRGIARDETRHAELSREVAAWIGDRVDTGAARRAALRQLRADLTTPACPEAIALAGFPTTEHAAALFDAVATQLWAA